MNTEIPIDFQKLLNNFKHSIIFKKLIATDEELDYDEFLYTIETNQGVFYVYEVDYFSSFNYLEDRIKSLLGGDCEFIEVITPLDQFNESAQSKFYANEKSYPSDFEQYKKYINWQDGSEWYYYNFLIKMIS